MRAIIRTSQLLALLALAAAQPAAAPEERPIAPADWPCWTGPHGNFSALPSGAELVEDLNAIRPLWTSEEILPGARCADARNVVPKKQGQISVGFSSPVVAGGKVYIYYYVPNGDVFDEELEKKCPRRGPAPTRAAFPTHNSRWRSAPRPFGRFLLKLEAIEKRHAPAGGFGKEKWHVDTDDVILCLDAQSGRTLWKRAFARRGMNFNCPSGMGFLILADGRILADADNSHDTNQVHLFRADPSRMQPLGKIWAGPNVTGYMNPVTPAIAGGRMMTRTTDRIVCFDLRKAAK